MDGPEGTSKQKTRRKAPPAPSQQQTADYIAEMAVELGGMAADADLPFLRYLIEMVADEAMREGEKYRNAAPISTKEPRPVRAEARECDRFPRDS